MNKDGSRTSQSISWINFVGALLGIIGFPFTVVSGFNAVSQSVFWVIPSGLAFILTIIALFFRRTIARYLLYLFLNFTAPQRDYMLTEKIVTYEFFSKTKMKHEKDFHVKVLHPSFSAVYDKYKWTGDGDLSPKSTDPQHYRYVPLSRKFGLNSYCLEAIGGKRHSKGDLLNNVGMVIDNIQDPQEKSSKHLSSGIYEQTDCLILRVVFAYDLKPRNPRKLEYIHYTDDDHFSCSVPELKVDANDSSKKYYEWVIKRPFLGGKYMIEWEWES